MSDNATNDLPSRKAVRDTIADLIGRGVEVNDGTRVTPGTPPKTPVTIGSIVADNGVEVALFVADIALSVFAGAALALLPKGGAEDYIDEKDIPTHLAENFYEVLNVLSSVFNTPGARHVRLGEVWTGLDEIPGSIMEFTKILGAREDLKVSIAGYGDGNLSIIMLG